jgi:hypothetical protein
MDVLGRAHLPPDLRAWLLVSVFATAAGTLCCCGYNRMQAPVQKPPSPPSQLNVELLYERPLDSRQEGVFSNKGKDQHEQVGAGQFVFPGAVTITGIRWYGYYNCIFNPVGTSPLFDISFLPDIDGLPAAEPLYARQIPVHVTETKASVPRPPFGDQEVYVYTVDSLPPISIPAGRGMWISISQAPFFCEWLWDRSSSVDGQISATGISENGRFSKWSRLKDDLAFSLYGINRIE